MTVPAKNPGYMWTRGSESTHRLPATDPVRHEREVKALLWLLREGHRDIAVMLGLLPGGGK